MSFSWRKKPQDEEETSKPRRHYKMPNGDEAVLNSRGLIPVILQDQRSMMPLHMGYMDYWALDVTLEEGKPYLYRRSKNIVEQYGLKKGLEYKVKSVILNSSRRALLVLLACDGHEIESSFNRVCYPVLGEQNEEEDSFIAQTADTDSVFPEIEKDDDSQIDEFLDESLGEKDV